MYVNEIYLRDSIRSAKDIAHQYQLTFLGADDPQRHVDNLLSLYSGYLAKPVPNIYEAADIEHDESAVYSMAVMLNEEDLDIVLVKGLNHCWRRFATAKEVFHAVLDREEFQSLDLGTLVEQVLTEFPNHDHPATAAVQAEFLAEVATMEFLFPYAARLKELERGILDFHSIALRYRIPRVKVERYLSQEYMNNLRPFE